MLNKFVIKKTFLHRGMKCIKFNKTYHGLFYWRFAHFGLFEDKLKEFKKEMFNRENLSKKSSTNVSDHLNVYGKSNTKENEYNVSTLPLENWLTRLKTAVENKEISNELYFSLIERIKLILIDEPETVDKTEIFTILQTISIYRPKEEEKIIRDSLNSSFNDKDILSEKHKEMKKRLDGGNSPISHVMQHFQENLSFSNIKGMLKDYYDSNDTKNSKTIYDIIEQYKSLFMNLELFIIQFIDNNIVIFI